MNAIASKSISQLISLIAIALCLSLLFSAAPALAEGSRSLYPADYPSGGSRANLLLDANSTYMGKIRHSTFLYVYAQAGEYILLGSSNIGVGGGAYQNGNDILVYSPQPFGIKGNENFNLARRGNPEFKCSTGPGTGNYYGGGRGRIADRSAELAGPRAADNSSADGFIPCAYQAPATGIYGVLFTGTGSGSNCAVASGNVSGNFAVEDCSVMAWDVTVRSSASSTTDINGRLFTYSLAGTTGAQNRSLFTSVYYVTEDGFRYKQTQTGGYPYVFTFYANAFGFLDSGQPLYKDVRGNDATLSQFMPDGVTTITAQQPEYPLFFSDITPNGANDAAVNAVLSELNLPNTPAAAPTLTSPEFTPPRTPWGGDPFALRGDGGVFSFSAANTTSATSY